jgi:outer membrane protein assembly factor BamD
LRRTLLILISGLFCLSVAQCDAQILHKKKKPTTTPAAEDNSQQPDKILYDRALNDIKHGRHESGRLNLQTLINTYPDSEYLAKAKLAISDSYYKEGGPSNMVQAISGYKDFIVFFPFMPEAVTAQMQVAMCHYQQMEKPDRDRSQARDAEEEFQIFLQKYPNDPQAPKAEQRLREVQEVLAEGDYRVGYYYFVKGDKRAAAARLISVTKRYPLYSRSDRALWMLGNIFETSERKDIAALYYGQIVRNYPKSGFAGDAKIKLTAFNVPVPQPDPKAVAWMTAEQNAPHPHESLVKKPLLLFKNGPTKELQVAAKTGTPNLQPEADNTSATDVLTGGGTPRLGGGGPGGSSGIVATVGVGTKSPEGTGSAENVAGSGDASTTSPPATNDPNAPAADGTTPAQSDPPAADATGTPANAASDTADGAAKPDGAAATPPSDAAPSADAAKSNTAQSSTNTDDQKESSSKKKKGIKKIIPW